MRWRGWKAVGEGKGSMAGAEMCLQCSTVHERLKVEVLRQEVNRPLEQHIEFEEMIEEMIARGDKISTCSCCLSVH